MKHVEWKRAQHELWSAAASGWERWSDVFERGGAAVSAALVDLADLAPGDRVLDVACGIGVTSLAAWERVRPTGSVVGTDLAEPMIEIATRRARERELERVSFRVHDAEAPFRDGPFDAAVSRFGVMLVPEPRRAAESVRDALASGGRFAAAVWGRAEETPFIALAQSIARREQLLPPPEPDAPGPLRLGAPGALEDVLRDAGYVDVRSRELVVDLWFASPDELVRYLRDMSATLKAALEQRAAVEQSRFWSLVEREAASHVVDGRVRLPSVVRCASGRRA